MAMTANQGSDVSSQARLRLRPVLGFLMILSLLVVLWEGYKLVGALTGGEIPLTDIDLPVRADDRSMPHASQIFASLFQPNRRGGEEALGIFLLSSAWVTFREALVGFVAGGLIGFALGLLFVRSSLAER